MSALESRGPSSLSTSATIEIGEFKSYVSETLVKECASSGKIDKKKKSLPLGGGSALVGMISRIGETSLK